VEKQFLKTAKYYAKRIIEEKRGNRKTSLPHTTPPLYQRDRKIHFHIQ
jgi:hypothetical protein